MDIHAKKICMESMQEKLDHGIGYKVPWTMELAITQSFFELETQDFTWTFVWTIQKKWTSMKQKN